VIAYQLATAYWFAAFPGLARNTPTLRQAAEKFNSGEISRDEYDAVDSRKRNEICNTGLYVVGIGEIPLVGIGIGILYGVKSNASTANNSWGLSVFIAWSSVIWLVLAIPWFILEKRRPGQPLPPGKNIVTAGLWQLKRAAAEIWRLKQTLAYLIGMLPIEVVSTEL
jgi:MFS-type transporter involved in bile tolerance (Atg22 family)